MKHFRSLLFFLVLSVSNIIFARPEYSVKTTSSCVACHVTPWGGGPKTVYGKTFGSAEQPPGKFSNQDLFSSNLRTISYYPTHRTQESVNGTALMEASGSVNAAVIESSEKTSELRAVLTYNMAPLAPGAREAYLRYQLNFLGDDSQTYILAGRFNAPFGLMTDEHRTYTRMQTNLTLNQFFTGVAVSSAPILGLNFDLALLNDLQGNGQFSNNDITWATVFNLRWAPNSLPFFIGFSQNYERTLANQDPFATSFYGALSIERLTDRLLPVQMLLEHVIAKNWNNPSLNPGVSTTFIPSSKANYLAAIQGAQTSGYYGEIRYDLVRRFSLIYKFDYLTFSSAYPADAFTRHGIGFETDLNSNLILDARYEKAHVGAPDLSSSNTFASQDALIAMLRLWL